MKNMTWFDDDDEERDEERMKNAYCDLQLVYQNRASYLMGLLIQPVSFSSSNIV